jgi:hypothetical protein
VVKVRSCALAGVLACAAAHGQPVESLAPYFGFGEARIVKVDPEAGPVITADFNGDGRPDVAVVNNRKSRIEIHYLRASPRTAEEMQRAVRANELPPNPWYEREFINVSHRVTALRAHDVDGDGKPDIIYAGTPPEIVVLRQESPSRFSQMSRQRIRDLAARQDGLVVADVQGDEAPEVITIAGGRVHVYPMNRRGRLGDPTVLGSGSSSEQVRAISVADFDGDGRLDLMGTVPEDAAPVRMWLQVQAPGREGKFGLLTSELRFEMPQIREAIPVRFPERQAASVGVIERASNRVVFFDLSAADVRQASAGGVTDREVQAEITTFQDTGNRNRSVVVADLNGSGRADLVTADQRGNAIVVYRQEERLGLASATSYPTFKTPKQVDVGRWFEGERPQIFTLSEEERAVGISRIEGDGRVQFPTPIPFKTPGATPVVMRSVRLGETPALAVILKDRRDYVLELLTRDGDGSDGEWKAHTAALPLRDVRRDPAAIVGYDFDGDGVEDLLILTPGEPMMMARVVVKDGIHTPETVLTKDTMPQFGLVQAAGPDNTALLDVDGDGNPELLIADSNYVRFAAYDTARGWRVVDQVNVPDATSTLVGVSLLERGDDLRVVASDRANSRLMIFSRNEAGRWALSERVRLLGTQPGAIRAGAFAGDQTAGVLAFSDDAFALVRLGGRRPTLEQFAAWTADSENRLQHDLSTGDINGDGFTDVVVLDAREQMCQILTFSQSRRMHAATEFKVFESRLFTRGESRELQPSDAIVADLTGDGAQDLLLLVHDRVIIYPQMTGENGAEERGTRGVERAGEESGGAQRPRREQSREPIGPG